MQLHEISLILVGLCLSYMISGAVNSEIFVRRLNRGTFKKGFDTLLDKSKIMKKVTSLEKRLDDPDFEKKIGRSIWESTRGEKGATMRGIYDDEKKMMAEIGDLGTFKYKNIMAVTKELDGLIQAGLVKEAWGETFLKWASVPRLQPHLDNIAGDLLAQLDGNSQNSSYRSKGSDRMWV